MNMLDLKSEIIGFDFEDMAGNIYSYRGKLVTESRYQFLDYRKTLDNYLNCFAKIEYGMCLVNKEITDMYGKEKTVTVQNYFIKVFPKNLEYASKLFITPIRDLLFHKNDRNMISKHNINH